MNMPTIFNQLKREEAVPPLYYTVEIYIDFLKRNNVYISQIEKGFLSEDIKRLAIEFLEKNKAYENADEMWLEYLMSDFTKKGE